MNKFGYKVDIYSTCTEDYHSGEEFGEWRSSYENSLQSVSPVGQNKYPDVVSTHNFKEGDKAYLVWIEYSTGDSFGHGERARTDAMGLFHDRKIAQELATAIEKFNGQDQMDVLNFEYGNSNTLRMTTSDGQTFESYASWTGYFETLEDVHVEEVTIS